MNDQPPQAPKPLFDPDGLQARVSSLVKDQDSAQLIAAAVVVVGELVFLGASIYYVSRAKQAPESQVKKSKSKEKATSESTDTVVN